MSAAVAPAAAAGADDVLAVAAAAGADGVLAVAAGGGAVGLSVALGGTGVDAVGAALEEDSAPLHAVKRAVAPPTNTRRRVERRLSREAAVV
jgi:hypothetical protein